MINRVSGIQTQKNRTNFGHGIEIYRHGANLKSDVMPKSLELGHYKTLMQNVLEGRYSFEQVREKRIGCMGQEAVFKSQDGDYLVKGTSTAFPGGYIEVRQTEDAQDGLHFRKAKYEEEKHSTADNAYAELADTLSNLIPKTKKS